MIATRGSKHIQHILCDISDDFLSMVWVWENHKSKLKKSKDKKGINTLPETNMAPKNEGFQ